MPSVYTNTHYILHEALYPHNTILGMGFKTAEAGLTEIRKHFRWENLNWRAMNDKFTHHLMLKIVKSCYGWEPLAEKPDNLLLMVYFVVFVEITFQVLAFLQLFSKSSISFCLCLRNGKATSNYTYWLNVFESFRDPISYGLQLVR